ncbi:MerR family transcriptional regulator [Luteimicrobium sp. NPDC057192]|uniref:transcriptional regulator FtsR n=1 Tax=Luteimicrobium sp. NPDC057192 TaxID=3346042 RepID=UPI00362F32F4
MASALARDDDPDRDAGSGSGRDDRAWPPGVSRTASMRISDVLRALRTDFPSISHSKLRFLEEQGLVEPVRTAAGYRQYSPADVERLRFVLVEQRDRYLPLKVIKDRLAELDAGEIELGRPASRGTTTHDGVSRSSASEPGRRPEASPARPPAGASTEERTHAPEPDPVLVDGLVSAGLLRPGPGGRLDDAAAEILRTASALGRYGIEPRHLRSLRTAVDRQVALAAQVVAPLRSQQSPAAHVRADETADEIGDLFVRLHAAWLRQEIADLA